MDSPYRRELEVAIGAVRAAATLSQAILSDADKGVTEKDDLSPVTVADFAIQALLTSTLISAFPTDGFVGEESADDLRPNASLRDRVWGLLQTLQDSNSASARLHQHDATSPAATAAAKAPFVLPTSHEHMCDLIDLCGAGQPGGAAGGRVWVFDPIDGTKTFVRGEMYAINCALLEGGRQVLSVVGLPILDADAKAPITNASRDPSGRGCVAFAARGHGTWVQPLLPGSAAAAGNGGEDRPRRVPPHAAGTSLTKADLRSVSCVHELDSGIEPVHELVAERLGVPFPGCDLLGWVPRWASLALGLANMTVWVYKSRKRSAKVWDHAGAMLLFEEVGGKITDVDGKDIDLGIGRKMSANYGFVAAPASLHALVLQTVHEAIKEKQADPVA